IHAKTPLWMQEKLRRSGIRSIDAVVDITNFVLLELGQPMHAFDLHSIDQKIIVRMARKPDVLTLLNGEVVALTADTVVIADQSKVLALAGIFGGLDSGINETTRDIVLECAWFNPLSIVGKARDYGLHTDASHRYERGVDPAIQYQAVERATRLILEICGGQAGPITNVTTQSELPQRSSVVLRRTKMDSLLGHHIVDQQVSEILVHLGCQVTESDECWQVVPPSWRFDISLEEDLIEEIARVYGYNNIPDVPLPVDALIAADKEAVLPLSRVKTLLVDRGFQEAVTYSFVDPKVQKLLHPEQKALLVPSPISSDMSAMRLSLWTGLLDAVIYNQNRQQSRIRLFESGLCFQPDQDAPLGVQQKLMLAGVITGSRYQEQWDQASQSVDFYDLKGEVERLVQLTGQEHQLSFRAETHPALHPGQSAAISLQDEKIGYIGTIHPDLERRLDLNGRTVVFELCCEPLLQRIVPQAQPISKFPANRRDIAIVVTENTPAQDVLAECRKVGANQLVGVNLFDVYRGQGITEGYKSLAISLILQDSTRTLEEDEIAAIVAQCVAVLQERFQASLRD
ncbi:MAG: phenylalanine--tRNA ligase subunit beta, partial [Enterobacteriaceae bacterium]